MPETQINTTRKTVKSKAYTLKRLIIPISSLSTTTLILKKIRVFNQIILASLPSELKKNHIKAKKNHIKAKKKQIKAKKTDQG